MIKHPRVPFTDIRNALECQYLRRRDLRGWGEIAKKSSVELNNPMDSKNVVNFKENGAIFFIFFLHKAIYLYCFWGQFFFP